MASARGLRARAGCATRHICYFSTARSVRTRLMNVNATKIATMVNLQTPLKFSPSVPLYRHGLTEQHFLHEFLPLEFRDQTEHVADGVTAVL